MSAPPVRQSGLLPMRQGSRGQLRLTSDTALPVHVAGSDDDILLVLLVDPGTLLDGAAGNLLLESVTSRGLVRMHGTAVRIASDLVRFHVHGATEILQRRQFVRVVAPQRVTLDTGTGDFTDTSSVNISGGGMLLSGSSLELDEEVRFSVYVNDRQPPIIGLGRVVRAGANGQRAIVFEDISRTDRERLIHFIFDRQRVALAVTRGDAI